MNLDRLKPENKGGKLRNLEEIRELECLIKRATRITTSSQTLLDVILTNKADLLVYGFLTEKVMRHAAKIIKFRSTKSFNIADFQQDLRATEWLSEDNSVTAEAKYSHWCESFNKLMDKHIPNKAMELNIFL